MKNFSFIYIVILILALSSCGTARRASVIQSANQYQIQKGTGQENKAQSSVNNGFKQMQSSKNKQSAVEEEQKKQILLQDSLNRLKAENDSIKTNNTNFRYLSSKVRVILPENYMGLTLKGTMRLIEGERVQMSIVMPIFGTEMVKFDVTPDDVLLIDRHDKLYVQAGRKEVAKYLPEGSDFSQLTQILENASKPGGRSEISGKELGLKSMKEAKVQLYDFSTDEFIMQPTAVPKKYQRVTLDEFVKVLKGLQ